MIRVHTDHVGSLLRPPGLLRAREAHAKGELDPEELKRREDAAVDDAISLQEAAGCQVITDGEYRRLSFQSQVVESVDGFGEWDLEAFLWGHWFGDGVEEWQRPRPPKLGVVGRLRRKRHFSAEEFNYLRARTRGIAKVTLPSPGLLANFWSPERSRQVYPRLETYLEAVTGILQEEVAELVRLGCTYIQLDAPHYPLLLEPATRAFYEAQGWSMDEWLGRGIELDNAVIGSFPGVTFGLHLCRGNQASRWLVSGGYEAFALPIFRGVRAHRFLLEYDDDRSGDFEVLRHLPEEKMAVLGLVTTKSPRRESVDEIQSRVEKAANVTGLERLGISPQCGFASSIVGNLLTEEDHAAYKKKSCQPGNQGRLSRTRAYWAQCTIWRAPLPLKATFQRRGDSWSKWWSCESVCWVLSTKTP